MLLVDLVVAESCGDDLSPPLDEILSELGGGPTTLIDGDLRADTLRLGADRAFFKEWPGASQGWPGPDAANLIVQCLKIEDRGVNEEPPGRQLWHSTRDARCGCHPPVS